MSRIKVTIIDDHKMFSEGLSSLLQKHKDYDITVINDFREKDFTDLATAHLVLLDINMPYSGLKIARRIKNIDSNIKIIIISSHEEKEIISEALKIDIDGYLLKNTDKFELKLALSKVLNNEKYYCKSVKNCIKSLKLGTEKLIKLSKREEEVLRLIVEEKTTQEIANELFLSINTIETHRKNLMRKIGVSNVVGLIKYAFTNKTLLLKWGQKKYQTDY